MLRVELLVVIATCLSVAVARSSPQTGNIQELLKNIDTRYSDNLYEDASLDVVSGNCCNNKISASILATCLYSKYGFSLLSLQNMATPLKNTQ